MNSGWSEKDHERLERIAKALESIAGSLAHIARPKFRIKEDGTVVLNSSDIPAGSGNRVVVGR